MMMMMIAARQTMASMPLLCSRLTLTVGAEKAALDQAVEAACLRDWGSERAGDGVCEREC